MTSKRNHNADEDARSHPPLPDIDLQKRLAFLELTAADAERLRECLSAFRDCAGEFVENFYRHLFTFDETSQFLQNSELVERLKLSQQEHFSSMLAAVWDDDYVERRRLIGRAHAERGIEPQFFLGSYNQFIQQCLRHFQSGTDDESPDLNRLASLLKAIFLDVGLTLDEYFAQSTKDLRQALDMYWSTNNELRQFAHFTSHDLKTPLGTVANLCEEVLDEFGDDIPADAREMIEAARRTTFRMSSTIDELLSTTIETDMSDTVGEISSGDAYREAIDRMHPVLERKRIELIAADEFPTVLGNKVQLREVFYNLISNAAKYIDKQPGRIQVGVQTTADSTLR